MSAFAPVEALGIRVYEVPGMEEDVVFVPDRGLAFIRADLSPEVRRDTAEWLISEAFDELTGVTS